ncbi:XRE family transcriptional regulator [Streptomyces sp. NPDC088733]|uniref:XRE family transcriptional regulator n=1 Tax=Streptomyces sp. NPDC088733 TaxID=3365880 RepID=UPI003807EB6D
MEVLHRREAGKPIRDAMEELGLSGPAVAAATKEIDPEGKGISAAKVGQLAGQGKTAKDRCKRHTGELVAQVLHRPLDALFSMPTTSTSTVER